MQRIPVEQALVTHDHAWNKWPDTTDGDYADVLALRRVERYPVPAAGVEYEVTTRFIPAYLGHVRAGRRELPSSVRFPAIDNTVLPHPSIRIEQALALQEASNAGCRVLAWDHAHQCFPDVACELRRLFGLAYLHFADDCPSSSSIATFPVANFFDALFYQMWIFDGRDGSLTADHYAARGLADCRWKASNQTVGLDAWIADAQFSVPSKLARIANGTVTYDLVFIGDPGRRATPRTDLLMSLDVIAPAELPDWDVALHGKHSFRAGPLLPLDVPQGPGYVAAPLYANALFGLNAPVSSIFNCRLMDLWLTACVQVVLDPWEELPAHGFLPWVHYLPCPSDAPALCALLREWKARPDDCARVAAAGHLRAKEFLRDRSTTAVIGELFDDYLRGSKRRART